MIFFISIVSCKKGNNQSTVVNNKYLNEKLNIEIDTVNIKIGNNQLPFYSKSTIEEESNKYFGYNHTLHSIDVFDLKNKAYLKNIKLFKDGPDKVESIDAFKVKNNEIHAISRNYIVVINLNNGKVKNRTLINSLDNKFYTENQTYITNGSEFKFVEKEGYYVKTINYKHSISKESKKHYNNGKILSYFSFKDNKMNNSIDISYPKEYQENHYGFNNKTSFFHSDDDQFIYYNFSALPSVFKYNKKTKIITQYNFESKNLPAIKTESIGWTPPADRMFQHYILNSNFGRLYGNNDYFFIIYNSGLPDDFKDMGNAYAAKKKVLLVFNKEFSLLTSIDLLNLGMGLDSGFVFENKLYFPYSTKNENVASFLTYNISTKQ